MARIGWSLKPVIAATLLCGPGCVSRPQPDGGQYTSDGAHGRKYAIQYLTEAGRLYLVIWADGCELKTDDEFRPGPTVWGKLLVTDGRRVIWCCETGPTRDGRDGVLNIGESTGREGLRAEEFKLSLGGLFLVHALERPVRIEQIPADLSAAGPTPDPESLILASGSDRRVTAFRDACLKK